MDLLYDKRKKRSLTGANVLTEFEVARIKRNLNKGMRPGEIAHAYLVGVETIRRIARGETWDWVKPETEVDETVFKDAPMTVDAAASLARLQGMLKQEGVEIQVVEPTGNPDILTKMLAQANELKTSSNRVEEQLDDLTNGPTKE